MKGSYPLTRVKLHRTLLELLQHPELHLTFQPLKAGGTCAWDEVLPPTNIRIKVDANSGEDVRFVIHELLHVIFWSVFVGRVDSTLEEVFIMALDEYMWNYVHSDAEREKKWRTIIKKKVQQDLVDIPLEQQADRTKDDRKKG